MTATPWQVVGMSLHDKDRIFTNVYGFQPWNLKAARAWRLGQYQGCSP
jgi:hypothetical protein